MRRKRFALFLTCIGIVLVYGFLTSKDYSAVVRGSHFTIGITANRQSMKNASENSTSPLKAVVVLTYMRSGSSLTGDILQHAPGAFYIYEPLHSLEKSANKPGSSITFANGTVRKWPFDFNEEAAHVLRHWLACDIRKLTVSGLLSGFLGFGTKSKEYRTCLKTLSLRSRNKTAAMYACLPKLQYSCEDSGVRVLKVLRSSMKTLKYLLRDIPELKIIHLIRDPRATLKSQASFGECGPAKGGYQGCSNKLCTALENNGLEQERLAKQFPDRILDVFYEDLAKFPIEISIQLYNFIGINFSSEVENYIYNITMAGNPNNCAICTTRSNASIHVDKWKKTIKPAFLTTIEDRCNYVLRRYNYSLYSQHDKNNSYLYS